MPGFLETGIERIPLSWNILRKDGLITSPGSFLPYFTTQKRMPIFRIFVSIWSHIISSWEKASSQPRDLPQALNAALPPCGCSPDFPHGIDGNFSGTYPPNIRGCSLNQALQESSQKVDFDEVTMTKFSLALLARQKHLQMRWLPVACEAAGPLLQFGGCVTNQVIALGRVHPLRPVQRPLLPAHLGGRGGTAVGEGTPGPQTFQ